MAQSQLKLRQFSTSNGLPTSFVKQVCQDERGYIWIATRYGLYRYDGYDVKGFKNDTSHPIYLPSNTVEAIATDNHGNLWVGTIRGLCRLTLKNGQVKNYTLPEVDRQRVNCFYMTRQGRMYVGGMRGLFEYHEHTDSFTRIKLPKVQGALNVQTLAEDTNGDLLIGTWDHGLFRYSPTIDKALRHEGLADTHGVLAICVIPNGGPTLLGTRDGLVEVAFTPNGKIAHSKTINRGETVYALSYNQKDQLVYVGRHDGLFLLHSDSHLEPTEVKVLVRSINTDRHGMFWFSTQGEGLYTLQMTSMFFSNSYSRRVQSVYVEPSGRQWVAFDKGVVSDGRDILPNEYTLSITPRRDSSQVFLSIKRDGFWTADMGGQLKRHFSGKNTRFINKRRVNTVYSDSRGNWWIGGLDGLGVRYSDGREFSFAKWDKGIKEMKTDLVDILEDKDGSIWILTSCHGALHLSGNLQTPENITCTIYNVENGQMPVNTPICLCLDSDGQLWLGTEGAGLCRYNRSTDRFETLQQKYHLPGDMVCSIEEDSHGHLWLGTNSGLVRLTIQGYSQGKLRIYTTADGLPDNFFEPRASFQRDGTFYFGSSSGLVTFRPKPDTNVPSLHRVEVTGKFIDGEEIFDQNDSLLVVPSLSKSFTLVFSSLTFQGQHQCTYTYRLVGFDREWHTTTADNRRATYSNLPPGNYTFELRATDDDGEWSQTLSLPIVVEPPFWRTWWAYLIYIVGGAFFAYLLIREIRSRMMTRNRLKLQIGDDGQTQVVVDHITDEASQADAEGANSSLEARKQLAFEIRDINFTNADEEYLKQAIACVNRHISDSDFTIPQMIEEMGTSRTTLFKKLKAMTGMNASGFINDIRLKTACRILDEQRGTSMRISDLAYSVGFNDSK